MYTLESLKSDDADLLCLSLWIIQSAVVIQAYNCNVSQSWELLNYLTKILYEFSSTLYELYLKAKIIVYSQTHKSSRKHNIMFNKG